MLRGRGMGWANRGPARLRGTRAERNPPARFPEASRLQGRGTCWRGQAVPCSSRGYYREHSRVAVRPERVGAAGVLSLDVHAGPPGLRSLRVRCASPSLASLAPTARSRPPAAPPGSNGRRQNVMFVRPLVNGLTPGVGSLGGVGRGHAQKPVTCADAGQRRTVGASNSHMPPASSMSPPAPNGLSSHVRPLARTDVAIVPETCPGPPCRRSGRRGRPPRRER